MFAGRIGASRGPHVALLYDISKQGQHKITCPKATCKMLIKSAPGHNFINILLKAFTPTDPKCVKMTVKLSIFFYAFGIYKRKSCS